ncbi:MAG: hypothetical protein WC934_14870 [Acidithiobacillus sp.]|jgi:tRNA uridine 5-carbamoylmethylation protein Kti12|uniref:hypothetical protein n=1 Tax=Acidithiobacillus sp. TaxID=1872118 RepID=UPI00355EB016
MIIFEGPPDSGKSTIINLLKLKYKLPSWDRISQNLDTRKNGEIEASRYLLNLALCQATQFFKQPMIYDRFHISEYVFGTLHRNIYESFAREHLLKVQEKITKNNGIVILLTASTDTLIERQKDRNKICYSNYDLNNINSCFNDTFLILNELFNVKTFNESIVKINTTNLNITEVFQLVTKHLFYRNIFKYDVEDTTTFS